MGNERRSYLLIHVFLSLEETKNETMTHTRASRCPPILYSTSSLLRKPQFHSELQLTQQKTLTFPDSFIANSQVTQVWSVRHMQKSLGISGKCVIFLISALALLFSFCQEYDHCSWRYSNHLSIMRLKSRAMNDKERKQKSWCSVHEHLCWPWISCPI